MPKLPRLTAQDAEKLLLAAGSSLLRSRGSHRIYFKAGVRVVVPFYSGKVLHPKTIKQVMEANAQTTPGRMTASALDREFMSMVAHSDQFEIRSSQLALQKSSNAEVRRYAQQMIQEHTQSTRQLTQLAAQRGVTLPNAPAPFNQAVIQQLSTLSGAEFDRAYLEPQANGHMQTVAVFRTQVGQGQDAAVKQFAAQLLPTIEGHYEVASQMTGQTNAMNTPMPNSMNPMR